MQSPAKYISSFIVDNFYGGKVLKSVIASYLESESLECIENCMKSNASFFSKEEEHKLVYTEIFEKYCNLMEGLLEEPLKRENTSIESFIKICSNLRESLKENNVQVFIDLILSVTDYEFFAELMQSADKRDYFFHILRGWQAESKRLTDSSAHMAENERCKDTSETRKK